MAELRGTASPQGTHTISEAPQHMPTTAIEGATFACCSCGTVQAVSPVPLLFTLKQAAVLIPVKEATLISWLTKQRKVRRYIKVGRANRLVRVLTASEIQEYRKRRYVEKSGEVTPKSEVHARAQARRERDAQFRLAGRDVTKRA